jgi:hypothetical protein
LLEIFPMLLAIDIKFVINYHTPISEGSVVVSVKLKAKRRFRIVDMLFFDILQEQTGLYFTSSVTDQSLRTLSKVAPKSFLSYNFYCINVSVKDDGKLRCLAIM